MFVRPITLILAFVALLTSLSANAHPEDEVRQVSLQIEIDDQAVVQRVRLPLSFALDDMFDGLSLTGFRTLEGQAVAERVGERVAALNPLKLDGVVVQPVIENVRIEGFVPSQPISAFPDAELQRAGALAFEARYPTLGKPPRRVSIIWRQIAPERETVVGSAKGKGLVAAEIKAKGKATLAVFSEAEPEHIWHRDEAVRFDTTELPEADQPRKLYINVLAIGLFPLVVGVAWFTRSFRSRMIVLGVGLGITTIALVGRVGMMGIETDVAVATRPDESRALELFTNLHRNIYRAFDYTDESAVYDALAQSVAGPELAVIYNDVYQSLILREEGGAVCKVQRVRINEASLLDGPVPNEPAGYKVRCDWEVDGLVQHHGHTHARTNRFEAVYTLAPREGQWRIIDTDVIEQRRTDDGNQTLEDLFGLPEDGEAQDEG